MNLDKKYLVFIFIFAVIWLCFGRLMTALRDLAAGAKQWLRSPGPKKRTR